MESGELSGTAAVTGEGDEVQDGTGDATPPRYLIIVLASFFGVTGLASASVAVATPDLVTDLGASLDTGALVVSVYALANAVCSPVFGRLADAYGLRGPLLLGVGFMVLGVVIGALAPTIEVLLAGRVLQGIGAAALPALSLAILHLLYSGEHRPVALSAYSGIGGMFNAVGPVVGGLIVVQLGWRPVVLLPVIILLAVPLLWPYMPRARGSGSIDVTGGVLVSLAATGLVLVVQAPRLGVLSGLVGAALVGAAAPALVRHINRNPTGFAPKVLVTNSVVMLAVLSSMGIPAAWFSMLVAIPAGMAVLGHDALAVGVAMLPGAVTGLVGPRLLGPLLARRGPLWALTVSNVVVSVALVLTGWGLASGMVPALAVGFALLIAMLSLGQPAAIEIVSHVSPEDVRGVAMGLMTFSFLLGGSLGGAYLGGASALVGFDGAILVLAVVPLLGLLAVRGIPVTAVRVAQPEV